VRDDRHNRNTTAASVQRRAQNKALRWLWLRPGMPRPIPFRLAPARKSKHAITDGQIARVSTRNTCGVLHPAKDIERAGTNDADAVIACWC
jgi:hypothetical protein